MESIFFKKVHNCLDWVDDSVSEAEGVKLLIVECLYLVIVFLTMPLWIAETIVPTKKKKKKELK